MRRRSLLLTLIVIVMISVPLVAFAGGQKPKGTATSTEPVTVKYMDHDDRFNLAPRVKAMFEEKYPNIKLEYIKTPAGGANRVHDKQVTMMAAGDGSIDIFNTDVIWPPEYAAAGWLLPLEEWFPPSEQKKYIPAMIDAQTVAGHVYGVPYLNDIGHLFYRKDLLSEGGIKVPETWMDIVEICQKLQNENLIGYIGCFFADQQLMCNYVEYLWSNNGKFLDETGKKIHFTEKASVDAIQFMVDMMHKYKIVQPGILTMGLDDGRVIFTQGRAVFHRNWNYAWSMSVDHEESKIKGKTGITKVPRFPNGPHTTCLGGWSYSVNKFTKNKEAAVKTALFLGSWDVQKLKAIEGDRTPTIVELLGDADVVKKHPVYLEVQKSADNAKARPKSPYYTQLSDIFQSQLQEALLQNKTPQQAVNDAADEIKPIIEQ